MPLGVVAGRTVMRPRPLPENVFARQGEGDGSPLQCRDWYRVNARSPLAASGDLAKKTIGNLA